MINNNSDHQNTIQRIARTLKKSAILSIIIPNEKDIDTIAASSALYLALLKMNKKASLVCKNKVEIKLHATEKFSPNFSTDGKDLIISLPYKEGSIDRVDYNIKNDKFNLIIMMNSGSEKINKEEINFSYTGSNVDTVIIFNSPTLSTLGEIYEENKEFFTNKEIINIDRHFTNTKYGTINYIDTSAASISEMIFDIIKNLDTEIDKKIATNLYNGIFYGTKNFTSYSVSPHTLQTAAKLLEKGAIKKVVNIQNNQRTSIAQKIFIDNKNNNNKPLKNNKNSENATKFEEKGTKTPTDWLKPKIFKGANI